MIENKFRGYSVNMRGWVYGYLLQTPLKSYIVEDCECDADYGDETSLYALTWYEVVPESVGQLVGRKDDLGFEMYTGDVVGLWGGEYFNGCWEFYATETIHDIRDVPLGIFMAEHARIYGNLYRAAKDIGENLDV